MAIGFRAVYIAARCCCWCGSTSNVREIASDSQAVVLRFGRIVRIAGGGTADRVAASHRAGAAAAGPGAATEPGGRGAAGADREIAALIGPGTAGASLPPNASAYLTGDGNVVLLNATLIYRINDPIAYALAEQSRAAALDRLFRATTVQVTAGRNLNDFSWWCLGETPTRSRSLAVRQECGGAARRGAQRLLQSMNARLQALSAAGASLGVEIERIDMTPLLPPEAKSAFDAVLVAARRPTAAWPWRAPMPSAGARGPRSSASS